MNQEIKEYNFTKVEVEALQEIHQRLNDTDGIIVGRLTEAMQRAKDEGDAITYLKYGALLEKIKSSKGNELITALGNAVTKAAALKILIEEHIEDDTG